MFTCIKPRDGDPTDVSFSEADARSCIRTLIVSMWVSFEGDRFDEKAKALFSEELCRFQRLQLLKPISEDSAEFIKAYLKSNSQYEN